MVTMAVIAVVLLGVAFYLTYLFSWCSGYDAAVRGSIRGSALWRQTSLEMISKQAAPKKTPVYSIDQYADMKRAVDAMSAAMWDTRKSGGEEAAGERDGAAKSATLQRGA